MLVRLKKNYGQSKLSSDMRKIINEPSRADVTFILDGGKVLHAHRCILMARCKTLEERVRQQGVNSEERDKVRWGIINPNHKIFDLKYYNLKAFEALMEYVYTDQIKLLPTPTLPTMVPN